LRGGHHARRHAAGDDAGVDLRQMGVLGQQLEPDDPRRPGAGVADRQMDFGCALVLHIAGVELQQWDGVGALPALQSWLEAAFDADCVHSNQSLVGSVNRYRF